MGFLTDLGNVAVGAIERDREITKEDLAIRAENLQANRQILINQKQKKYDKELESFYKEKEKYDTDHSAWLKISLSFSTLLILLYFIFPSKLVEIVSRINII